MGSSASTGGKNVVTVAWVNARDPAGADVHYSKGQALTRPHDIAAGDMGQWSSFPAHKAWKGQVPLDSIPLEQSQSWRLWRRVSVNHSRLLAQPQHNLCCAAYYGWHKGWLKITWHIMGRSKRLERNIWYDALNSFFSHLGMVPSNGLFVSLTYRYHFLLPLIQTDGQTLVVSLFSPGSGASTSEADSWGSCSGSEDSARGHFLSPGWSHLFGTSLWGDCSLLVVTTCRN